MRAVRLAGGAAAASVPDEEMAELGPFGLGHQHHQVLLDLFRVAMAGQAEPMRQARDVGVHHHANIDGKGVSQDHVRRLAPDAAQGHQFLHRLRDFAAVIGHDASAGRLDAARLVFVKTGGPDFLLQSGEIGSGKILRGTVLLEQCGRDQIHAFVGALRGENGGHQQFERVREIQFAVRGGIGAL